MNPKLRALLWWSAPAMAFFALLGIETDWGGQLLRVPAAPQATEPKPVAPVLLPEYQIEGGVAGLSETVDRTLFNPTRRPAPPATASAEGDHKMQSGQFVLTGTTLAGDRSIAFLKELAGGKARTVRKGDKINGLLVAEVLPDRVRFTHGDESEELMLKVAPGPKTTVAAAAPAVAAPAQAPRPGTLAARRAAAAAARDAAAGEGQAPAGGQPQTGRGARAAAARAAADSAAAAAANNPAPAGNTPTDAWGQVYQRMQRGNGRAK
jgi:pyruvate/2-oxoglutarate dehydrogenase complex dihydrolipoamide acyltransferase (E2) component